MVLPALRQGAPSKVAAKFQTAAGVPATAFANVDLLRADEAPAPDPGIETLFQQGAHGSLFERDEPGAVVATRPRVEATVKAQPSSLLLFLESLFGVAPVAVTAPFAAQKIEGFNVAIPKLLTYVWDDTFETLRVSDVWTHTIRLASEARENLLFEVEGLGVEFDLLPGGVLAGLGPDITESYSHKESSFFDEAGATPVNLALISFELEVDHGRFELNANSVAPSFIGKDGRISVTATIRTRVYADTFPLFERHLNFQRVNYRGRWVSTTGKKFEVVLRNCEIRAARLPAIDREGRLGDWDIEMVPRQTGTANFPVTFLIQV